MLWLLSESVRSCCENGMGQKWRVSFKERRKKKRPLGWAILCSSQTTVRDGALQSGAHAEIKGTERPKRG